MKLKVLVEFRDKNDHKTMYKVGQIIEVADHKRAANLVARDLCDFVEGEAKQNPAKGRTTNEGGKTEGPKKDSGKKPDDAAGNASENGSESDNDGEQGSDQE